jgi:hypothetical protein
VNVEQSAPFEAVWGHGVSGIAGTAEGVILDNDGNAVYGPTNAGIAELEADGVPTGIYAWQVPAAPATVGQYTIAFSPDGSWDPDTNSSPDDLVVMPAGSVGPLPPLPPPDDGGPSPGPSTAWTTSDEVAACCSIEDGTDPEVFDPYVDSASQLLYLMSGRLYYGLASKDGVRPLCQPGCGCGQILSRGHIVAPPDWKWWGECSGPCDPSRVLLSGYPVRSVTQVKIDGVVLDPAEYRLERYRWLVRLNGESWPSCQSLGLADTEEGTWSVSYTYGQSPPQIGRDAANELACQLYKACAGDDDCAIPAGAVRLTRAGVTIERGIFSRNPRTGAWATGMMSVDLFLNAVNPQGLIRRPVVTSPASRLRYARKVA